MMGGRTLRQWYWAIVARFHLEAPPKPHQVVYRLTGGLIGARLPLGVPRVLLLTTTGSKSGKPRTTPVMYLPDGDRLVIVASNSGKSQHPGWYWNLKANPQATVQIGRVRQAVIAEEATPDRRQRLWPTLTEIHPLYAEYQRRITRQLPVIILHPVLLSATG